MPRGKATKEPGEPGTTLIDEKGGDLESDSSLTEAAKRVFGEDLGEFLEEEVPVTDEPEDVAAWPIEELEPKPDIDEAHVVDHRTGEIKPVESMEGYHPRGRVEDLPDLDFGRPDRGDLITVRGGGLYLPARRRVAWMRGEPKQHPDWTVETREIKVVEGTFKGGRVEGGYARIEANVYDQTGRLIASGRKTEYSERFLDYVEKAETGAIGRALAVAGYGTEAALDLDEGLEADRLADAPVGGVGRPISITPSSVPGVSAGGRSSTITSAQTLEIARLSRSLKLGQGLTVLAEEIAGRSMPDMAEGEDINKAIQAFLKTFTFDEASSLIGALSRALKAAQEKKEGSDAAKPSGGS